jgi:hypothetical protein
VNTYILSPIVEYLPFLELAYFSSASFERGEVVEVVFANRKLQAVVLDRKSIKEARFDLRKANFKTQKILSEKALYKIDLKILDQATPLAEDQALAVGEVLEYLKINQTAVIKNSKSSKSEDQEVHIFADTLSLELFKFTHKLKNKQNTVFKPQEIIQKVLAGERFKNIVLHTDRPEAWILPSRPHINQLPVIEYFLKLHSLEYSKEDVDNNQPPRKFFVDRVLCEDISLKDKNIEKEKIVSEEVLKQIEDSVRQKQKVFVFVFNHGYTLRIYCNDCGRHKTCNLCKSALQYVAEDEKNFLFCKSCDIKTVLKKDELLLCEGCGGYNFNNFGIGIGKVAEYIANKLEGSVLSVDEREKRLSDKTLINKVNDEEVQVVVGTLRALRASAGIYKNLIVTSLGALDVSNEFNVDQKLRILEEISNHTEKMYIERVLSAEEERNKDNKSYAFWQKYKNKELQKNTKKVITFVINKRHKKKILPLLSQVQVLRQNDKSIFTVYILEAPVDVESLRSLVVVLRPFGDLVFGERVLDFTFTRG